LCKPIEKTSHASVDAIGAAALIPTPLVAARVVVE